ncbi:MAG TPA: DUF4337 family protein [Polyangia bacterium]|jgi:hypothetical protein
MEIKIPDALKADVPATTFGKVLAATPVVMAVVSTMLAGLASSEMTRAQYDRSLGAQQQSKAGDQWSFFQAKRLRGALQEHTADLLATTTEVRPLDPAALRGAAAGVPARPGAEAIQRELAAVLASPAGQQALGLLQSGAVPPTAGETAPDPRVKVALAALETFKPDAELVPLLAQVDDAMVAQALTAARDRAQAFDAATRPVNQAIDRIEELLGRLTALAQERGARPGTDGAAAGAVVPAAAPAGAAGAPERAPTLRELSRDFTAVRLRYAALRYETEARLNQVIANMHELEVRRSNFSAERHHRRSQQFFFGMLGAQLGVIVATFALAARNRNLLWSLAAAAGLIAVAFAVYVYLRV